jgi:hypothetical protein
MTQEMEAARIAPASLEVFGDALYVYVATLVGVNLETPIGKVGSSSLNRRISTCSSPRPRRRQQVFVWPSLLRLRRPIREVRHSHPILIGINPLLLRKHLGEKVRVKPPGSAELHFDEINGQARFGVALKPQASSSSTWSSKNGDMRNLMQPIGFRLREIRPDYGDMRKSLSAKEMTPSPKSWPCQHCARSLAASGRPWKAADKRANSRSNDVVTIQ